MATKTATVGPTLKQFGLRCSLPRTHDVTRISDSTLAAYSQDGRFLGFCDLIMSDTFAFKFNLLPEQALIFIPEKTAKALNFETESVESESGHVEDPVILVAVAVGIAFKGCGFMWVDPDPGRSPAVVYSSSSELASAPARLQEFPIITTSEAAARIRGLMLASV